MPEGPKTSQFLPISQPPNTHGTVLSHWPLLTTETISINGDSDLREGHLTPQGTGLRSITLVTEVTDWPLPILEQPRSSRLYSLLSTPQAQYQRLRLHLTEQSI